MHSNRLKSGTNYERKPTPMFPQRSAICSPPSTPSVCNMFTMSASPSVASSYTHARTFHNAFQRSARLRRTICPCRQHRRVGPPRSVTLDRPTRSRRLSTPPRNYIRLRHIHKWSCTIAEQLITDLSQLEFKKKESQTATSASFPRAKPTF